MKLVEISLSKCRQQGIDVDFRADSGVVASEAQLELIDLLLKHDLARLLADPNITVLAGKPASVVAEAKSPVRTMAEGTSIGLVKYGVRAEIRDLQVVDRRVSASILCRHVALDESRTVEKAEGVFPATRETIVETKINAQSGDKLLLGGLQSRRRTSAPSNFDDDSTTLVLVVTPTIRDGGSPAKLQR